MAPSPSLAEELHDWSSRDKARRGAGGLPPVAGVAKEENLGRLVQHNTGLGIGVVKDTPNNGRGSGSGAFECSVQNGSNYPTLRTEPDTEQLPCTDSVKMEEAPCESGHSGQEGTRTRPPQEFLGRGGTQVSRAQPRVGGAIDCLSNPPEVVGSQRCSPSSDQAKSKEREGAPVRGGECQEERDKKGMGRKTREFGVVDTTDGDRINVLHGSDVEQEDAVCAVFPAPQLRIREGEAAEFLTPFDKPVGGDVTLDRRTHTTRVKVFMGARAVCTQTCGALLDTGSPASFIQQKVVDRMLACGSASEDGLMEVDDKTWGGFNGVPLVTNKRGRLNIQFWVGGKCAPEQFGTPTACTAVYAYVVPDGTMKHDILLGRDSWEPFPVRQERDVSDTETIVTFVGKKGVGWSSDRELGDWVGKAIGMVEVEGGKWW